MATRESKCVQGPDVVVATDTTISVTLKDGTQFSRVRTTTRPFGDHDRIVMFWVDGVLRVYPMGVVALVEFTPCDIENRK